MAVASTQRGLILRPPYTRPSSYHSPPLPTALRFPRTSSLETSFFSQQNLRKCSSLHSKTVNSRRPRCLNSSTETGNKSLEEKDDASGLELGSSAKSRGQIFLERALDKNNSAQSNIKKRKKKKNKIPEMSVEPVCYGCGAPLQTVEVDSPGYVTPETYELKKKHRQLRSVLCGRCRLLSHGHMLTAVGGHGGYSGGKQFISAEQLREKLSHLRHDKALIVKLVAISNIYTAMIQPMERVDIFDFNGSFLARVCDLVGANPIIMIATKVDLLPKGTDLSVVGDWLVEATIRKKLNVLSIHLTSSKLLSGFVGVVSEIQQQRKGSANVGKSAFINALLSIAR